MRLSREWATPATIGAFALVAGTGVPMFFHLETGLQKALHEWIGWLLLAAVALHVAVNWLGFKRYLKWPGRGIAIVGVFLLALGATFFIGAGSGAAAPASPPVLAMRAVAAAPLATLEPLTGKPVERMLGDLAAAGVVVDGANGTVGRAVGNDREAMGRAMRVLFGAAKP
ncbi:MAG: DUF4405 domain-containing protein [Betaproteobacteria bacterium]|nr:DUF4405 domain-containing protein [Betaproteobacteria bacterium]MCC6248013.1 DUF4405 domain-containing protein [Rubrivivax sp.]MCL4698113.1 DUF4405 domain-containing protein [Burkholderiaceae bacterium]